MFTFNLMKHLEPLTAILDKREKHERIIALFLVLFVIYFFFDLILLNPIILNNSTLQNKIIQTTTSITKLKPEKKIVELRASKVHTGKNTTHSGLQSKIHLVNKQLQIFTSDLISNQEMIAALKQLLKQEKGLHLIDLHSTTAQPLLPKTQVKKTDEKTTKNTLPVLGLYKHGFIINFSGDFFSTLDYLKRLEQLSWTIYWDTFDYSVKLYPEAEVYLNIHTLSQQESLVNA